MTTTEHTQYSLWLEGHATAQQAATELAAELKRVQFEQEMLAERERILRTQLSEVVASHGEPISAMGLRFELTAPTVVVSYNRGDIERFVLQLVEDGYAPIAQQLHGLAKKSERAGSLRVTKEKAK